MSNWTKNRTNVLIELWRDGLTGSQILKRFNALWPEWDVSRSAIIGKVNRMGLPSRPSPVKKYKKTKNSDVKKSKKNKARYKKFLDIPPKHCLWPVSNGWCGDKQKLGKNYCEEHDIESKRKKPKD